MIDSAPDAVKDTCLNMKREQRKKLELKVIGGNYYLYVAKCIRDKKKKKPVKKKVLMGSIDETGTFREKRPKRIFSSSRIYEYGSSHLVWNLAQEMYRSWKSILTGIRSLQWQMVKAIDPIPLRLVVSRF